MVGRPRVLVFSFGEFWGSADLQESGALTLGDEKNIIFSCLAWWGLGVLISCSKLLN